MNQERIKNICKAAYLILSFCLPDILLRVLTRWLGYYSIFALEPNLFTFCWALLFVSVLSVLPGKRVGRIVYGVLYSLAAVYALTQYGYYLIFDKFYYWSNVGYAQEGTQYLGYALNALNGEFFLMLMVLLTAGVIGIFLFPNFGVVGKMYRLGTMILALTGILLTPLLYRVHATDKMLFRLPEYEYQTFRNSGYDMELMGMYQYAFRDGIKTVGFTSQDRETLLEEVDSFLSQKQPHQDNQLTGLLEGKNLILVQLESVDYNAVSQEVTPTIAQMMDEGINLTNFYACGYGSGLTFATEFACNIGIYQNAQGTAAHSYMDNVFPYSIANLMKGLGYRANSFHKGHGSFYNRSNMHKAFGYEDYHQISGYTTTGMIPEVDETMIRSDACWEAITRDMPFFGFLITYSAHLPYTTEDTLARYAVEKYSEYVQTEDPVLAIYHAKARLTDDFLAAMLERLEADGLMKDTAILVYNDHPAYGLESRDISTVALTSEDYRMPAFIWYDGCTPLEVDKICQTVDLLPTIANLYGVDVTAHVPGSDIFDDAYEGIAIFPNGTWLTADAYVENGVLRWGGLSREQMEAANAYVSSFYRVNEAILASDYYRYRTGENN